MANGVKPIIGIEAYVTPETARQDPTRVSWDTNWNPDLDPLHRRRNPDDVSGGGVITHLTMWAENDEGLVSAWASSMTRCVPPANSKTFSAAIISTSNSWTTA